LLKLKDTGYFPTSSYDFSLRLRAQTGSGVHPAPYLFLRK